MNSAQVSRSERRVTVLSFSPLDHHLIESSPTNRRRGGEIRQGEVERPSHSAAELVEETQSSRICRLQSVRWRVLLFRRAISSKSKCNHPWKTDPWPRFNPFSSSNATTACSWSKPFTRISRRCPKSSEESVWLLMKFKSMPKICCRTKYVSVPVRSDVEFNLASIKTRGREKGARRCHRHLRERNSDVLFCQSMTN